MFRGSEWSHLAKQSLQVKRYPTVEILTLVQEDAFLSHTVSAWVEDMG